MRLTAKDYEDKTVTYTLTLRTKEPLRAIGLLRLRAYIEEAVDNWGGQYFPGDFENDPDPLFYGFEAVKARRVK